MKTDVPAFESTPRPQDCADFFAGAKRCLCQKSPSLNTNNVSAFGSSTIKRVPSV